MSNKHPQSINDLPESLRRKIHHEAAVESSKEQEVVMNQQNKTERWVEKLNEMGFNHPPLHQFIRNLLLETKKRKKCINNYSLIGGSKCRLCGDYFIPFKPSPQPQLEEIEQMKKLDSERELVEIDRLLDEYPPEGTLTELSVGFGQLSRLSRKNTYKINELADRVNQLSKKK